VRVVSRGSSDDAENGVKSAHLATNEKNGNKVEFLRHLAFAGVLHVHQGATKEVTITDCPPRVFGTGDWFGAN
jgi:hypothetical protein